MNQQHGVGELITALDPLTEERAVELATHRDAVWSSIQHDVPSAQPDRRRRLYWSGPLINHARRTCIDPCRGPSRNFLHGCYGR